MEFAFPSVVDIKGRPFGNWTIDTPLPASARVMFPWRGRQRLLRLFHNDVAAKEMVVVYNDRNRNDTVAEIGTGDNCFHVGFVKGEPASYAAVSTCAGLVRGLNESIEHIYTHTLSNSHDFF